MCLLYSLLCHAVPKTMLYSSDIVCMFFSLNNNVCCTCLYYESEICLHLTTWSQPWRQFSKLITYLQHWKILWKVNKSCDILLMQSSIDWVVKACYCPCGSDGLYCFHLSFFYQIVLIKEEQIIVDNAIFRLLIAWSVLEIVAIRVKELSEI